jgi:lipooligosaccharide transport system permease protein
MFIESAVAIAERRMGKFAEGVYSGRAHASLERSWIAFKQSTWLVVLSGFLEPVLYLFAFGYGLQKFVGTVSTGNGQSVTYAMYLAPGLLATSAMNGAIYDSTWNVFWKLREDMLYQSMLTTSMGTLDVALGEIVWALLRGLIYAMGFMIVVTPLGLIPSWWGILAVPGAVIIAFGFASVGMGVTSYIKSHQQMDFINIIMLPLFLFSGSLYPLTVFPGWLQGVIKALPLWQAISMIRDLTLGNIGIGLLGHLLYFTVMIVGGLYFTTRRLTALFLR